MFDGELSLDHALLGQFLKSSEQFSPSDWSLFAAIAAEKALGLSALTSLGFSRTALNKFLKEGFILQEGEVRPVSLTKGTTEPGYKIPGSLGQVALRETDKQRLLRPLLVNLSELLGHRSVANQSARLQAGSLIFRPDAVVGKDPEFERDLLNSTTLAFDPAWLCATWKERTPAIVARVLCYALGPLAPCTPLYRWAVQSNHPQLEGDPLLLIFCTSHALHRQEEENTQLILSQLDSSSQLFLGAVLQFQKGEVSLANNLLDQGRAFAGARLPDIPGWSPLLALLLLANPLQEKRDAAEKWWRGRTQDTALKSAKRGLRTFLRYRDDTEGELRPLSPYKIPPEASAWEILFLGLTVYAFNRQETARRSWSKCLFRFASLWSAAGYSWMARQAQVLSFSLHNEQFSSEIPQKGSAQTKSFEARPGDLAQVVHVRQAWQIGLSALKKVAVEIATPTTKLRLQWYVSPQTASLNHPGLQEHHPGWGWTTIRRIPFNEAIKLRAEFPHEDQRALQVLKHALAPSLSDGLAPIKERDLPHAATLEALIQHPRVIDAARGGLAIEIVRGICQVETHEEPLHLRICVSPAGLGPGLNILSESEGRLSVVQVSPAMHDIIVTLKDDLRVPHAQANQALAVLGQLREGVPIKSPHLQSKNTQKADSTPTLRLTPVAGAWIVESGVRPFGPQGRFFLTGTGPALLNATHNGRNLRTERDFDLELKKTSELLAACSILCQSTANDSQAHEHNWTLGRDDILVLLSQVRASKISCAFDWPQSNAFALRGQVSTKNLHATLRSRKGWYVLSGSIELDNVTHLSLAELTRMPSLVRGRFIQLKNGDFIEVEKRVRRVLASLQGVESPENQPNQLKLSAARLASLQILSQKDEEGGSQLTLDNESRAAMALFEKKEHAPKKVSPELKATLRDYQVQGVSWLCHLGDLGLGACLADDMGLGKTIQIIAYLLTRPPGQIHLVVAPTSVCTNWLRELARFAPTLQGTEYIGAQRQKLFDQSQSHPSDKSQHARVFIVSYALLNEDRDHLKTIDWDTIVLDEAQFIKNPHSMRARAAFSLPARCRIAATGTPVENNLGDLWSLFHFINPDLLGNWRNFQVHFVNPIQRDNDHGARDALRRLIRPFLLRRTKDQVLKELPPLTRLRKEVQLNEQASLRYAGLRKEIYNKLYKRGGSEQSKLEVLAEITRLRRYCCHPRLVYPDAPDESPKLDAFLDLAAELLENKHRVLVFSQYVDFLHLARERLEELGLNYEYLDGSTPKAQRQESIDRFQGGEIPLFLISLKAGGLGLNLTAADFVIHLDPWWNPAVASQATDRAHRIGQNRPVTVYEFVTRDTIEEDILRLHASKKSLADSLLAGGEKVGSLSAKELIEWLKD